MKNNTIVTESLHGAEALMRAFLEECIDDILEVRGDEDSLASDYDADEDEDEDY